MSLFFSLLRVSETSPNDQMLPLSFFTFSVKVNAEGKLKHGLPKTWCIA